VSNEDQDLARSKGAGARRYLKIFLDDQRLAPEGWHQVRWPDEAIVDAHGTGYDVLLWIEEAVATRGFAPPRIQVHSVNVSARQKMEAAISSIKQLAADRASKGQ
jgi:hypothetical protein